MTPEQPTQDIVTEGRLETTVSAGSPNHSTMPNGEQTSLDGDSALTFASDADFEKVLELFWSDVRFRATPREHVGDRTIIVPSEVVERLRKENIPFEVRQVARAGDVSPGELSRIRYKNGVMTGPM
jgi:hypothetical protein